MSGTALQCVVLSVISWLWETMVVSVGLPSPLSHRCSVCVAHMSLHSEESRRPSVDMLKPVTSQTSDTTAHPSQTQHCLPSTHSTSATAAVKVRVCLNVIILFMCVYVRMSAICSLVTQDWVRLLPQKFQGSSRVPQEWF